MRKVSVLLTLLSFLIIAAFAGVEASGLRRINPINTPGGSQAPAGFVQTQQQFKVERAVVVKAVHDLMDSWNTMGLEEYLSNSFFDKHRLLDDIDVFVPRHATIRVLSIQGIQTLQQFEKPDGPDKKTVISTVSATVCTQVEFNDPQEGFKRLEGEGEYVFIIKEFYKRVAVE